MLKYLKFVKNREFVRALAVLSTNMRYKTSKRIWMAFRLGLHKQVLNSKPLIKDKRYSYVYLLSYLKRHNLSDIDEHFFNEIESILRSSKFSRFHEEIINELLPLCPKFLHRLNRDNKISLSPATAIALNCHIMKADPGFENYRQVFNRHEVDCPYTFSNLYANTAKHKLDILNNILIQYELNRINIIDTELTFGINNLSSNKIPKRYDKNNKVSILVTTYNSAKFVKASVLSLLNQTWQNVEVIVIDDASTDDTVKIVRELSKIDQRLKLIELNINVGTYLAKSIGEKYATGRFLTCQDSDDWAHPDKIEAQTRPLIKNNNLIATSSHWLRLDKHGDYYVRQVYPYMRQNPASPLFRRKEVKEKIGLWHCVKTGADSEFWQRLILVYGKNSVEIISKPLTLASHRAYSLMTSKQYGAYSYESLIDRLDYWESWRKWHIDSIHYGNPIYMPSFEEQLNKNLFYIPKNISLKHLSSNDFYFKE